MQVNANVKLLRLCQGDSEGECQQCYCRPMWCLTCMGKWFASRQDQQQPETWLSSRVPCPTCRAKFCILDVCPINWGLILIQFSLFTSVGLYDTEPGISEHFWLLFQNLCASQATIISNDSESRDHEKPEETIHLILLKHSLKKEKKKINIFPLLCRFTLHFSLRYCKNILITVWAKFYECMYIPSYLLQWFYNIFVSFGGNVPKVMKVLS